ncbi:hypothetical protein BDV97DRAFT_354711 [Delphinella strobiligena]|nr:hypothetical protein BDV97DRAFT_354711 [Delphinella strobiligena]
MSDPVDIQGLLRFLTKDAKVSLALAISKVKDLQQAQLASPDALSKSNLKMLSPIFNGDDKVARAVLNAAKRLSKKRAAGDDAPTITSSKRRRNSSDLRISQSPSDVENSLRLPMSTLTPEDLEKVVLTTNRAPLLLAFAYAVLEFTMPEQPGSSKLSLAQAVVSAGSRAKAVSIGLAKKGEGAEDQGWGKGQPLVKVLGREIPVLRRWGYEWKADQGVHAEGVNAETLNNTIKKEASEQDKKAEHDNEDLPTESEAALWALDLEQLKQLNGPLTFASSEHGGGETAGLPVYSPHSAQSYLLRAFETFIAPHEEVAIAEEEEAKANGSVKAKVTAKGKRTGVAIVREKEENLGALLRALKLLFQSWIGVLGKNEMDRRAWSWYVSIRPEVEPGVAGWGAKGQVKLKEILDLRRKG